MNPAYDIIHVAAEFDPEMTITWLEAHPAIVAAHDDLWGAAIENWVKKDVDAAWDYVRKRAQEDPKQWNEYLFMVLGPGLKGSTAWFESHLAELPADTQFAVVDRGSFMVRWAKADPVSATKWALSYPSTLEKQPYRVWGAFIGWSSKDPDEAWRMLDTLSGSNYEAALNGYASGTVMHSVDEGVAFLAQLKASGRNPSHDSQQLRSVLDYLGTSLGVSDSARGLQLLDRLSDPKDRADFAYSFLGYYNQGHPQEALAIAHRLGLPVGDDLGSNSAQNWARKDGPAAVAWARAEPGPADERQSWFEAAIEGWTSTQPEAAAAYIRKMPPGPEKNNATLAWCYIRADEAPEAAMSVAAQIPDQETRAEAMRRVFDRWEHGDQATLEKWFQTAAPADQARLRPPPTPHPEKNP
jgi:hypothetical protein